MASYTSDKSFLDYLRTTWGKQDPNEVVEEIAQGKYFPTQAFLVTAEHLSFQSQSQSQFPQSNGQGGKSTGEEYRTALVAAGAVDKILEFLLKSNEDFREALPHAGKDGVIQCPSIWLQIIGCVSRDGFLKNSSMQNKLQYKVVNHIQGVFLDVSDFEKRKFFGRRDSWIRSLLYFSALLRNLITSENPHVADFLLNMPPIKHFLVRTIYMELGGIPKEAIDEIREFEAAGASQNPMETEIIGYCQSYCAFAIKTVTEKKAAAAINRAKRDEKNGVGRDHKDKVDVYALLGEFAITPVVPGGGLVLGTGLVKLLENSTSDGWYRGGYTSAMILFLKLYDWGGRLSGKFGAECVSSNLVSICRNYLLSHASKKRTIQPNHFFENVTTGLVVLTASIVTPLDKKGRQAPIDFNVSNAINSGLLEYCCDMCDACTDSRFVGPLTKFLKIVFAMAKFPLTKTSIQLKADEIRAKIERVKDRPPFLFACLPEIEKIVEAAVADEETTEEAKRVPKCEFCGEKCGEDKKTKKKCPFCKSVVYCSSDCLRLNYMLHQDDCLLLRKYPAPKPSSEVILREGKELFAEQLNKIMLQASLKGFSIVYCYVVIDMAEATPIFRTLTEEQFFQSYKILEDDVVENAKETFERNKEDGALTVSLIGFSTEGLYVSVLTFPPDAAPTHGPFGPAVLQAFETDKWTTVQRNIAGRSFRTPGDFKKLQGNRELWTASIMKSMKP
ncbi:unnamed protein product [Pseudo-nitzschia multistriata]|uniref:MYND-type domain-containing protein n=1 Tax=Pseudo-nitzschia multistriata TaxID=183589 RepID=A0A448ZM53_9STRA|nr:unnamed protein product [Pseudo-nitzschia multistriata]